MHGEVVIRHAASNQLQRNASHCKPPAAPKRPPKRSQTAPAPACAYPALRLAITDEASPLALRSTRNRPRSHGRWPPRRMRMATPGQARLSLVRASPCPRLMRGPSRHHELLLRARVSASFPRLALPGAISTGELVGGGSGGADRGTRRGAGCRQGRGGGLPSVSLLPGSVRVAGVAARRSAPTRRSPPAWRPWRTGCRRRASPKW
jgi:hypothetical protein